MLELDVSIIDTFFFGSLEYKPPLVRFVILGTFILKAEFVDIPAAKIVSWFTPVTPTPKGASVRTSPLAEIALTLLNTGSENVP